MAKLFDSPYSWLETWKNDQNPDKLVRYYAYSINHKMHHLREPIDSDTKNTRLNQILARPLYHDDHTPYSKEDAEALRGAAKESLVNLQIESSRLLTRHTIKPEREDETLNVAPETVWKMEPQDVLVAFKLELRPLVNYILAADLHGNIAPEVKKEIVQYLTHPTLDNIHSLLAVVNKNSVNCNDGDVMFEKSPLYDVLVTAVAMIDLIEKNENRDRGPASHAPSP